MADGGHHEVAVASSAWFTPVAALVSSVLTAFLLFAAQRLVGKAAWQTAITAANKDLIDQLQEERREARNELATERLAWAGERAQFRGDLLNVTQALESLKSYLRREGIHVPELPYHPASDATIIEGEPK